MSTAGVKRSFSNFFQRSRHGKHAWLLALAVPVALFLVDFHFVPSWLSPRLEDFGPRELIISQGQELVLQKISFKNQEVLSCDTTGDLDIDLTFESARLSPESAKIFQMLSRGNPPESFQKLRYLSHTLPSKGEEPCRNSFILYVDESSPPQDLRLAQPDNHSPDRFRLLQARFSEGNLTAYLEAPLSPEAKTPGPSCRKRFQIGGMGLDFYAPFNHQVFMTGGELRLRFERLSNGSSGSDFWPDHLLHEVNAQGARIVEGADDRAQIVLEGRRGEPTIQVKNIKLEADRMKVEISGEGSMAGQQAPSFVEALDMAFNKRPKFVGALLMLLLALNGGLAFVGAAFMAPKGREASDPVQVFVSYSRKDAEYLEQISLPGAVEEALRKEGIELWKDREIVPGDDWDHTIREQIAASDIALVLVSQDYLHSGYCSKEIRLLLNKSAVIVPIILSDCNWQSYDWVEIPNCLPGDDKTVKENYKDSKSLEELFTRIQDALRKQAENVREKRREKRSLFRRMWKPRPSLRIAGRGEGDVPGVRS